MKEIQKQLFQLIVLPNTVRDSRLSWQCHFKSQLNLLSCPQFLWKKEKKKRILEKEQTTTDNVVKCSIMCRQCLIKIFPDFIQSLLFFFFCLLAWSFVVLWTVDSHTIIFINISFDKKMFQAFILFIY